MQKRVSRLLLLVVAGVMALSLSAGATTLVGSPGAGWQSWTTAHLNKDGTPYWDNPSQDGNDKNIGYFLSKTGAYASHPLAPGITPDYWGYSDGSADLNFHFNSPLSQTVKLVLEVAGLANVNELGWYDVSTGLGGVIFPGLAGSGSTAIFSPSTNFGLYIKTSAGVKYYTQSMLNPSAEQQHQHFAVFKEAPGVFWIGIEDKPANTGEGFGGDYNDMVIRMAVIPEPATMSLFALGLLPLLRRRKA